MAISLLALDLDGTLLNGRGQISDRNRDAIEKARSAGVRIIAFRCGGWLDPDLVGAIETYDGPWDLLANLEGSLLFLP